MSDVIVIGGGIVGASAAYALACEGVTVTLIDREDTGYATAAGAGIIAPATSLHEEAPVVALMDAAVGYYPRLLAQLSDDGETETGYAAVGALVVATTEEEVARLAGVARGAQARRDRGTTHIDEVRLVDAVEACRLFPPLAHFPAALHIAGSARIDGRLMRSALRRAAERRGARIVQGDARPLVEGGRVAGVESGGTRHTADAVILAGGAWSAELARSLGFSLPVYPQRGQILHMEMPDVETGAWPIVLGFHAHYLLTFPKYRVVAGATREHEAGFDPRVTVAGIHEVTGEALRVAPELARASLREVRVGLRPASPDGLPILGRAPGIDNLIVATGHGPSGLQLGPHSGVVAADLARGKESSIDLAPFSVDRFA
jgi:D-amino-acid dehydrogenase